VVGLIVSEWASPFRKDGRKDVQLQVVNKKKLVKKKSTADYDVSGGERKVPK
jgi:hypothetical protein